MIKYAIWPVLLIITSPCASEHQLPTTSQTTPTTPPSVITLSWNSSNCLGGNKALLNTGLWMYYNITYSTKLGPYQTYYYFLVDYNSSSSRIIHYNYGDLGPRSVTRVLYDLIQLEHGGGDCQCVNVEFRNFNQNVRLCGGVAYEPRIMGLEWNALHPSNISSRSESDKYLQQPFIYECSSASTKMHISFTIYDSSYFCNASRFESLDDIEVSIRLLSYRTDWVPIAILSFNSSGPNRVNRRGYITQVIKPSHNGPHRYSFEICNILRVNSFQLRWLISSVAFNSDYDKWSLDDLDVVYEFHNSENYTVFRDQFDTPSLNLTKWTTSNVRNGYVTEQCNKMPSNYALAFGVNIPREYEAQPITYAALTNVICISKYVNINTITEDALEKLDTVALDAILNQAVKCELDNDLSDIDYQILYQLQTDYYTYSVILKLYILAYYLNNTSSEDYESSYFQTTCDVGNSIIQQSNYQDSSPGQRLYSSIFGVTLLQSLDQLLILLNEPMSYSTNESLAVKIQEFTEDDYYASFSTSDFYGWSPPYISASLPIDDLRELFEFNGRRIRTMISVYRNLSHALPEGRDELIGARLVSDVVGINLHCRMKKCPTRNISLPSPIQITFQHSSSLTANLQQNKSLEPICAFLEIFESPVVIHYGRWSTSGCLRNKTLSSTSRTVCECSHLTHFGILLSAKPIPVSEGHRLALSLIGYVGVSISIIAMVMTVTIFIAFKSLRNLRSYIHGNLCISLAISQIIFVAGINRVTNDSVPIHCQVIAVLLHYFFLVSFMWMLMEGVYLYVALFVIFDKNIKPYFISFTVISYGVPLFYMGALTIPIGFGYFNTPQYGYRSACFLATKSHFIWAFIAPVILVFIGNIGFFIMTAVTTYRHMKKESRMKKLKKITWLKGMLSLTVIMGLTWIIGLAAVEEVSLTFLVYIYTIFIAFQGTLIFIIFIIFAQSVQDSFKSCWTTRVKQHSINMTRQLSMKIPHSKMKNSDDEYMKYSAKTTEL